MPMLLLSQDTWINIEFQFDDYAEEVSWSLSNSYGVVASGAEGDYESEQPNAFHVIDSLESGEYTFELLDAYGDGLSWPNDGYCLVSNTCQDTLFFAQGDYGIGLIESLTIAPCAPPDPPVVDCMDENALNYNPDADVNDLMLCEYPPCESIDNIYVEQSCDGGSAILYYNWDPSINPNCNIVQITYGSENTNEYVFNTNIDNGIWGVYAGNGTMPPNWEDEFYAQFTTADSLVSDTIFFTPYPCTQGCTDENAPNYNPWATVDDGSCGGQACEYGYTPIVIEVTLDNWPGETGWSFVSGDGSTEIPDGTYTFQDVGQTYTYNVCALESGFEFIISDTFGDGMAGSTSGGTVDGDVVIKGCDGEVITSLSSNTWVNAEQDTVGVGFGNVAYSTWQQATICGEAEEVLGCTDFDYQEFNPAANTDDGSCLTEHVFGCINENAFNYDSLATQMEIYPNCNYELWIGDAGADGWGNSFLGVVQGDNQWSFTMGPGQYEQTFPIWLETDEPVKIYYFEVGGAQTPPEEVEFQTLHNSFKLTNANGTILLYEGWNPFADNGQGALQSFSPPFYNVYQAMPFCGTLCIPTVEGCLDSTALNYNEEANTDDGSCVEIIPGCTQEIAFNYDENANFDDGSCVAEVIGCMDITAWNYNENANTDGGDCIYLGCTDVDACNYNSNANADSGGCTYPDDYYNCSDICINDADADGVCDELEISGCTAITSTNYDPEATEDDGSCIAIAYGCTDPTAFNYNENANTDNGSCETVVFGCIDSTSLNYNADANTDNGSCIAIVEGCTNSIALNYNENANVEDGSCILPIYGCTDNTALNYDENANTDNGSCITIVYGCTDSSAINYNENANVDDFSCIDYIYGCTDSTALNYNELANTDNGTCIEIVEGCTDSTALNYNELANVDDFSCIDYVYGCTDSEAFNYNELANTDNGSCIEIVLGCTDSTAFNYNSDANTEDFSCIEVVYGCTDSNAFNYDELANTDNGTCIDILTGCTDVNAYNYDGNVNTDDGSCEYDAGCSGGPGVPYWLPNDCFEWVISIDTECCTGNWNSYCVELYNYCDLGWPIDLEEMNSELLIYPNPVTDILNMTKEIDIKLYDMIGNLVISKEKTTQIDMTNLPSGIYNLNINHNNKIINNRIVKQ